MIYTRPDGNRYDFTDIPHGTLLASAYLTPDVVPAHMTLLHERGAKAEALPFANSLHTAETAEICGPTVLMVPPSGLRFEFFVPMRGINLYIGSDVFEDGRRSGFRIYAADGTRLNGDKAAEPFGPVPDPSNPPPGAPVGVDDMQWMVWHMPPQHYEPGDKYYNPIHGIPCAYLDFMPDSGTVWIGRLAAEV